MTGTPAAGFRALRSGGTGAPERLGRFSVAPATEGAIAIASIHTDADAGGRVLVGVTGGRAYPGRRHFTVTDSAAVFTGGPARPFALSFGCTGGDAGCDGPPAGCPVDPTYDELDGAGAALTATGVVQILAPCTDGGPLRMIQRAEDGTVTADTSLEPSRRLGSGPEAVDGDLVAYRVFAPGGTSGCGYASRTVVRDLATGAVRFTSPPARGGFCPSSHALADNRLWETASTNDPRAGRLRVYDVADGRARRVPGRLADAVVAAAGARAAVVLRAGRDTQLALVGLDGAVQPIARFNDAWRRSGAIDFDGTAVTWAESRCGKPRILRATAERPRRDPPARCRS